MYLAHPSREYSAEDATSREDAIYGTDNPVCIAIFLGLRYVRSEVEISIESRLSKCISDDG